MKFGSHALAGSIGLLLLAGATPAGAQRMCADAQTAQQMGGALADVVALVRRACRVGDQIVAIAPHYVVAFCDPKKDRLSMPQGVLCALRPP